MTQSDSSSNHLLISYLTLRKVIGWLGILLPVVLVAGTYLLSYCKVWQSSISHYYYTGMGEIFVGTLCAVSTFLFTYKGPDKIDGIMANFAGAFALGVVLFPTSSATQVLCNTRTYVTSALTGSIHLTMAALFFLTLAYMSYFLFTRSNGEKTAAKKKRNIVYKICAIIMVGCLVIIAMYILVLKNKLPGLEVFHPVFSFEALALFAFGFSWLTKGEALLKD